jgi:hypothetical protein
VTIIGQEWGSASDQADIGRKVAACERALEVALGLVGRNLPLEKAVSPPSPGVPVMPEAVFEEFGRATKSFRACLLLASNGFGQPAQALASIVAESSLIVVWAIERGVAADHLADLHARYGLQLQMEEWDAVGPSTEATRARYMEEAERSEARERFGPSAAGLWTGHATLADLMADLISNQHDAVGKQYLARLKAEIARAGRIGAGTGLAHRAHRITRKLDDGKQVMQINLGSGPENVPEALHLAGATFLSALDSVVNHFQPELAEQVRAAEAFAWRAWKDPQILASLKDDDPCPCDKPGTLWGNCHKWTEALGTVTYTPLTDADLVRFNPYDPQATRKALDWGPPVQATSDLPSGPHVVTFTFTLPFTLGLEDTSGHTMTLEDNWADPNDIGHFGRTPTVVIRLHNEELDDQGLWRGDPSRVLQRFYGKRADEAPQVSLPPLGKSYEQWVSVETPGARLLSERQDDPAYAFHRCLIVLNSFLAALELAVSDLRITTISTHEIGPVVLRGAFTERGRWVRLTELAMHPDAWPVSTPPVPFDAIKGQFADAFNGIRLGRPFMYANLWHGRAQRAFNVRGDRADGVVNLQTAVESMMYDLLRGLLVDEGKTLDEIATEFAHDIPFKRLLISEFAPRLGGSWNVAGKGVVGEYWSNLYTLRNRVVHAGYLPGDREADLAQRSFLELREYVSERLNERSSKYPRTLLAKVGVNGLERRGWMTARMKARCAQLTAEQLPFYWPKDKAGR